MSADSSSKTPSPTTDASPATPKAPVIDCTGASLKREREKKGISLEHISQRTRISNTVLKAIEAERFQDMPPARVYVRGFLKCIAEEIGLPEENVVAPYVRRWEKWNRAKELAAAQAADPNL